MVIAYNSNITRWLMELISSNHQQSFKYILRQSCLLYINAIYDYLLSKVCSTANVVELIVVRA